MTGRLLIISHTPHYRAVSGVVGWGATVREIDQLATLFDLVVHLAPVYDEPAPASALPYSSPRVSLRAVQPAGGDTCRSKCAILLRYPAYMRAILDELRTADVVHVRAPANLSLLAMLLLTAVRAPRKRWFKYAGNWAGGEQEPWSYRLQRWWLGKRWHRGQVTVNGHSPAQLKHVRSFYNPCLTEAEIAEGARVGRGKRLEGPVRLLFVGRVETDKGVGVCLDLVSQLLRAGIPTELDLIGDGPERPTFERVSLEQGIQRNVQFHGSLPRTQLGDYFASAHFVVLPSATEGWPKVLSEGMAYGAVPLATAVGSIPEYLTAFGTGQALGSCDPGRFARAIQAYWKEPARWKVESQQAVKAARHFSYRHYLTKVATLLELPPVGG